MIRGQDKGVPRSVRLQYPGAHYHVMARGNRRQTIFRDGEDRHFFLKALGEACERTGWRVHAWVLMDNHYHLHVETPEPNLVDGMKWLQNTYTRRFNTRHREWGRLFGDRYKAIPIERGAGDYYCMLVEYLHLNPVRARLVRLDRGETLLDYRWSSLAAAYAVPARRRAPWMAVPEGLAAFNCPDTAAGRRRYVERLDGRARQEPRETCGLALGAEDGRRSDLRRGWYWGSQVFADRLHAFLNNQGKPAANRTYRSAPQHREHDRRRAESLVKDGMQIHGLTTKDLWSLPGSDSRKVEIAKQVWEQTTAGQAWIAERLQMKSAANVSQILRRASNGNPTVKIC